VGLERPARKKLSVSTFAEAVKRLHTTEAVREAILRVTTQRDFPMWMSISDKLVLNPIWKDISVVRRERLTKRHRLDGSTAPAMMHLDMLLIRPDASNRHGELYTYFSKNWNAPLIPYRQWLPEDSLLDRHRLNAAKLALHWGVPQEAISVQPLPGKYAVSAKPQVEYGDLILYVFEFCAVSFLAESRFLSDLRHSRENETNTGPWYSLRQMRDNSACWEVNGDVIRAIHELFTVSLAHLPMSFPQLNEPNRPL